MKIKTRNDILADIIRDGKKHPDGWNAAFGGNPGSFSHDCYMIHPHVGVYLLKEYSKNPYVIKGVGSKVARHVDDDITEAIKKQSGAFGILQGNIKKILDAVTSGIPPRKILEKAFQGNDLGLRIPVRGHASTSLETYRHIDDVFSQDQKKLTVSLDKMVSEDGLYNSYE